MPFDPKQMLTRGKDVIVFPWNPRNNYIAISHLSHFRSNLFPKVELKFNGRANP